MARTKSATAKAAENQLFLDQFPQCADAVQLLHKHGFGPEHAHSLLHHEAMQNGAATDARPIAKNVSDRLEALSPKDQAKVLEASSDVAQAWPQFLSGKGTVDKSFKIPDEWTLENTASPKERAAQQGNDQNQNARRGTQSRMPTAGQAVTATAGLAAAGGAVASWRDREQQRNAPQQDASKSQGKLAKTLAFAAGAVVLLGAAVYAYSRSQEQGAAR